ncbi:MAG: BrnT family toxin [Bifidobacterium animalis]|nr:BrnT family toxin [Bifidobacterium animalis]MDY5039588.1 BrnT family toxin [Bifidobacterium animalis]
MEIVGFEWDDVKASTNVRKHGVTFEEAETVFNDPLARVIEDPDHSSYDEERFIILGMSTLSRLLVVCHCYRTANRTIRIISARKATRHESNQYAEKGR